MVLLLNKNLNLFPVYFVGSFGVSGDLANIVSPVVEGRHQGVEDARSAEDFQRWLVSKALR